MPDLKLAQVYEAADPERLAPILQPFLGTAERPRVAMTRLQPPICYWALYEHAGRKATLKCFFQNDDFVEYREKLAGYYPERVDNPTHPAGGLVFLPEVNGLVWGFPFDPVMPDLARCVDGGWVAEMMGKPGLALETKVVDYNPEIGAILAYRRAADGHTVAYGKVSTEETCGLIYLVMRRLWDSPARKSDRLALPKPLAFRPRSGFLLQARVRGRPIPPERNSQAFMDLAKAAGPILAALHESDVPFGPERGLDYLVGRLEGGLEDLALTAPPLYLTMRRLIEQLRVRETRTLPEVPVGCHGDFKYDQLLKYRRRHVLIDYEMFCQAEPALDLGTFCAYLPSSTPADWREGAAAELLRTTFLRGYERAGHAVAYDRLALYEAAMLATRALSFAWGQGADWQLRASALLDLAFERLVSPEPPPEPLPRRRKRASVTAR